MEKIISKIRLGVAVIFIFGICLMFVTNEKSTAMPSLMLKYIKQNSETSWSPLSINSLEEKYSDSIKAKNNLYDFNSFLLGLTKAINTQYNNLDMYITDDKYIISTAKCTSGDYEIQSIVDLNKYLVKNNIGLLYVNQPTKYLDDSIFAEKYGIESFSNRNADEFLSRLREEKINYIDLRESIKTDNLNIYDMFYRTDHHWTVPTGLWAARKIAEGLNEYSGYNIDTTIWDIEKYKKEVYTGCWLGEQGRKFGAKYTGLEDFTALYPTFETSFQFNYQPDASNAYSGTFDDFVKRELFSPSQNVYDAASWHYAYEMTNCINNNVSSGKILLLCDSYSQVMEPFLALGVNEINILSLRDLDDSFSLKKYISENNYDTVVIAYAQFMIGAHDDPNSDNYRMFCFE